MKVWVSVLYFVVKEVSKSCTIMKRTEAAESCARQSQTFNVSFFMKVKNKNFYVDRVC